MTPAYVLGSFGNLRRNREYNVADKAVSSKTLIEVKLDEKVVEEENNELLTNWYFFPYSFSYLLIFKLKIKWSKR